MEIYPRREENKQHLPIHYSKTCKLFRYKELRGTKRNKLNTLATLLLPPITRSTVDLRYHQDNMMRNLPPLNPSGHSPMMMLAATATPEHRAPSPLHPVSMAHDISRPSSTSTQSSNALAYHQNISLPGLSTLATVASAPNSQYR